MEAAHPVLDQTPVTDVHTSPNISILVRASDGEVYFVSQDELRKYRLPNPEEVIENLDLDRFGVPPVAGTPEEVVRQMATIDLNRSLIARDELNDAGLADTAPALIVFNLVTPDRQHEGRE